ncbi:MAG: peptidoglycan-binding domain-containing protein [Roseovarius sp.]
MAFRYVIGAAAAAAMLAAPVQRAQADEFVGGLVGGLIGGAIGSSLANQQRNNQQTRTQTRTVYVNPAATAQRQQNREIQTSLNYFGFNAGVADGVMGGNSRAAVARYQVYMGYPGTGQISEYEKSLLLGAYQRALAGGPEVNRMIAQSNDGVRAVLLAQRDGGRRTVGYAGLPMAVSEAVDEVADSSDPSAEQLLQRSGFIQLADLNGDGKNDYILNTALAGSSFWCNANQCKTMVFASTANGYTRNDMLMHDPTPASFTCVGGTCQVKAQEQTGQTQLASVQQPVQQQQPAQEQQQQATTGFSVPVFNTAPKPKSLNTFCTKVNMLTSANGGFTTVSTMSDPNFTMSEQFCLARTYAVSEGEELIASVQGATQEQIAAQCEGFGKNMEPHIAALATKPANAVLSDVSALVLNSGMTPAQLRTTAQICMANGYQTDRMTAALGSALLLTALGERPVAELVGHHLHGGFGVARNGDLALGWYEMALAALDGGAAPAFAANQPGRVEVLRKASMELAGETASAVPTATSGALPVFTLAE